MNKSSLTGIRIGLESQLSANPINTLLKYGYLLPLTILILSFSSCGVIEKAAQKAAEGVTGEIDSLYADQLSKAFITGILDEFNEVENQQQLRQSLDSLLGQTTDTLENLTFVLDNFLEQSLGQVNGLTDSISTKLDSIIKNTKKELLDETLENYLRHLFQNVIQRELDRTVDGLWQNIASEEELTPRVRTMRQIFETQIDSLIASTTNSIATRSDSLIDPLLNSTKEQAEEVIDQAESSTRNIIRYAIFGLIGVVIIGALIFQLVWKNRYKSMLKVITKNIDEISSQQIYDQLTQSIKGELTERGLEKSLRKEILEEQGLTEQPEWDDKDQQILNLLLDDFGSNVVTEPASMQTKMSPSPILQKIEDLGLTEHFESLMRRKVQ